MCRSGVRFPVLAVTLILYVEKYWIPFFSGRVLGDITWADVDAFISHLEGLPLSPKWKNRIITSGAVPLKWAFHRGMIDADVSAGHTKFSGGLDQNRHE